MLKCSYCGKENLDDSTRCGGCGTALANGSNDAKIAPNPDSDDPLLAAGKRRMVRGAIWFFGGSAITLLSYASAVSSPYGGHYVVAWGAIIFGAYDFFQGQAAAGGRIDRKGQAQDLLEQAARLEGADRAKAVALYEEIVRTFPGTRASKEAQSNIETLTYQSHENRVQ